MCGESSHIKSGFGNYTREVLSRLHSTEKYDIAELSCYRTPETIKTEPWKIYPVAVLPNHPSYQYYASTTANEFGQWRFDFALLDWKPDIVIDIRDFWTFVYQENSPLREFYHWVVAPTYDSSPLKIGMLNLLSNVDTILFHTEWAKNDLKKYSFSGLFNSDHDVVSDAVDSAVYKPCSDKGLHKNNFGIETDTFIIGSVMRNQRRKLIPDLLKVFSELINKNQDKKIILYLHTSFPEPNAWDIPSLLLEYNIINKVLFTYNCQNCKTVSPMVFKGSKTICPKCNSDKCKLWEVGSGIDTDKLNDIYNLFDVYVQYAVCEGFGIPVVEAASCGVPVISINYGAMGEVCYNVGGKLVNISKKFREVEINSDRVYPDNNECISIIQYYIDNRYMCMIDGTKSRNLLLSTYSWDKTAKKFENIIDNIELKANQGRWNINKRITNTSIKIPDISNNRNFIYYIIDHLIKEPQLKYTSYIEEMILNLDNGIINNDKQLIVYTREHAIKSLEIYANNKIALEKIRCKESDFPQTTKYFFSY